jgi:hypothetical protein
MYKCNKRIKEISILLIMLVLLSLLLLGCDSKIKSDDKTDTDKTKTEYKTEKTPTITKDNIRRFSIKKDGKTTFELLYNPTKYKNNYETWSITEPYKDKAIVDTEQMFKLFEKIESFQLKDSERKAVEIEHSNTYESSNILEIDYIKDNSDELYTSHLYLGEKSENGTYQIRTDNSDVYYEVPESVIDEVLNINPFNYILKIAFISNINYVKEVDIKTNSDNYQMISKDNGYFLNEDKVSEDVYDNLYMELMSIMIQKEIGNTSEETQTSTEKEPLLEITYQYNKNDINEKKVKFLTYNDTYASIQVDDSHFFLVNKTDVEKLIQTIENNYSVKDK